MPLVFRLPPKEYEFAVLFIIVYWILAFGHAAANYGFLVGIPLLPLLVIQISLGMFVWRTLTNRVTIVTAVNKTD
ncbi:uncharacterized protein DEA37_0009168 [Paragonimus westermani]|uniref:Uncharacterized protein n=1 Tax=Paragonimus westermani TaxID=34504 RepID=A0A5J4NZX2_9TREM|nr:uncharacterized protein DEA37_0009168 [Paragonimus westermani]